MIPPIPQVMPGISTARWRNSGGGGRHGDILPATEATSTRVSGLRGQAQLRSGHRNVPSRGRAGSPASVLFDHRGTNRAEEIRPRPGMAAVPGLQTGAWHQAGDPQRAHGDLHNRLVGSPAG